MTQIERLIQVKIALRTIDSLDRQLFYLHKDEKKLIERILDKNAESDVRDGAQFDLDNLKPRIAALEDRRFQQRQLIDELDAEAARQATVKVVSETRDRAQIVITYTADNGKKTSYTRHVRKSGTGYVGFSTLTTNKVTYRLPGDVQEEAA